MQTIWVLFLMMLMPCLATAAEQWAVIERSFDSTKTYANPFMDVQVDAVFRSGDREWRVPAFWAGGGTWTIRFAPPVQGEYTFRVKCSDASNKSLNGNAQPLKVTAYTGSGRRQSPFRRIQGAPAAFASGLGPHFGASEIAMIPDF